MKLVECPRDAMQGLPDFIPTATKTAYLNALLRVGFDTLDFGSFVSPKAIPQLRDTAEGRSATAISELLRSQAAPSQYQNWDADEHQQLSCVDVSDHVDMSDRERLVRSAVASLHPRQLEAIELAYFGGRNYREVADKLGVAEGTIKGRIRMGLLVLSERTASI